MINQIISNIIRFFILVFVQIVILNNIQVSGFINPFLYVMFILLLPFETPGWLLLLLSFFMGLSIDMFSNTMGMHAAASVALAYFRPKVIRVISPRDGYETESKPTVVDMGFRWFFIYTIILVFIHHLILFFIESFSFHEFFSTLGRVLLSSVFTIALIILSEYLFTRTKTKK